ncbi:rCG43993, partial [Rattus norvegicus]
MYKTWTAYPKAFKLQSWRDGSVVKSASCSCREPGYGYRQFTTTCNSSSQGTDVISGLCSCQAHTGCTYMQADKHLNTFEKKMHLLK